jgi:hypothetical protein
LAKAGFEFDGGAREGDEEVWRFALSRPEAAGPR